MRNMCLYLALINSQVHLPSSFYGEGENTSLGVAVNLVFLLVFQELAVFEPPNETKHAYNFSYLRNSNASVAYH